MTSDKLIEDHINGSSLLYKLHSDERKFISKYLKYVKLSAGKVLFEAGDEVNYAYFPCGETMISFIVSLSDAKDVECALVGREGAVGGIVSEGRLPAYTRAIVQIGGAVLKIKSQDLEFLKRENPHIRHFFSRYADCLIAQIFQSVACNATHSIEKRAAKWLIAVMEHSNNNEINLTQEHLANLIGVGRSYVTRIIGQMKKDGAIETYRKRIKVIDECKLRAISCNCNELVKNHFEEVLKGVYPSSEIDCSH